MDLCCEIKWKHQSLPKYTFCYTIQYCCRPAVLNGSKVRDIFIFDILSVSWKYLASHVCHFHKLGGGCCTIDCLKTVRGYDVCAKLPLPWIGLQLWWITTVVACFSVHEGICWCRTVTWRTIYLPPTHKWKGRSLIFPSQKAGTLVFTLQSLHPHHYSNSFSYFVWLRGCFSVISVVCNVPK